MMQEHQRSKLICRTKACFSDKLYIDDNRLALHQPITLLLQWILVRTTAAWAIVALIIPAIQLIQLMAMWLTNIFALLLQY